VINVTKMLVRGFVAVSSHYGCRHAAAAALATNSFRLLLRRRFVTSYFWSSRPASSSSSSSSGDGVVDNAILTADLTKISPDRIRNFSIIAHIDHGKSTLADRLLEFAGAIKKIPGNNRILDNLKVEKDRGITVKAQTASIIYKSDDGVEYLLNLIDTPGHVDFNSEVSRSLLACQGVVLLVDANQGVQAQTVSNFFLAFANDLAIVPVLNKIDLPGAKPEEVKEQMANLFEIEPDQVISASAKLGIGVKDIFEAVVSRVPPPSTAARHQTGGKQCVLLQDSWYDTYRGTVNLVQVVDGLLKCGDEVTSAKTGLSYPVKTLGILTPKEKPIEVLSPGQIGVMTCNMKSPREAVIGDTFYRKSDPLLRPLVEIKKPKPMVFAGVYPFDASELPKLRSAVEKVCLNDYSVSLDTESSPALGLGWRVGFLGLLHMEVFSQRLEDEYDAQVLITTPSVPYKLVLRDSSPQVKAGGKKAASKASKEMEVCNPALWPASNEVEEYLEPMVTGTIICPQDYVGAVYGLCAECRGVQTGYEPMDAVRIKMDFLLPLNEIVVNFFDRLKSVTSGYGSFDYEDAGYQSSSLIKVDILLNDKPVQELSTIVHASHVREKGHEMVDKLVENLPRQQFKIKVQAVTGSKVWARGDVKPYRKDVTAKCYGGDITRKMKLLKYQAEGKKRMKAIGNVEVSKEAFIKLLT